MEARPGVRAPKAVQFHGALVSAVKSGPGLQSTKHLASLASMSFA
jgi:hypothetical protein